MRIEISQTLAAACAAASPVVAGEAKLARSDLDPSTAASKAELDHGIDAAAQEICTPDRVTGSRIHRRACTSRLAQAHGPLAGQVQAGIDRSQRAAAETPARTRDTARQIPASRFAQGLPSREWSWADATRRAHRIARSRMRPPARALARVR
jgi:hypothetical protein